MPDENPMDVFAREAPEIAAAFGGLIQAVAAGPGLDPKTKHLVYIAMKASQGDALAVRFHVPMAKNLGATRDEIKDAILLTLTVSGIKGVATCLPLALKTYDES